MISYAVTINDEMDEFINLINMIHPYISEYDELVILHDWKEDSVIHYKLSMWIEEDVKKLVKNVIYKKSKLNGDFAKFKNELNSLCTKDWIINFDADEYPHEYFIKNIKKLIQANINIDMFLVPRANIVDGITPEHIKKWQWYQDALGRINWPDYQARVYKNNKNIKWEGKVHEKLVGYDVYVPLPDYIEEWCFYHIKKIEKQEKQNNFYETL